MGQSLESLFFSDVTGNFVISDRVRSLDRKLKGKGMLFGFGEERCVTSQRMTAEETGFMTTTTTTTTIYWYSQIQMVLPKIISN